jgi:hypothetical protein
VNVRRVGVWARFAITGLGACSAVEGLPPLSNETSDAGQSDASRIDAEPASADSSTLPSDASAPDAGSQDATVPNDAQVDGDGAACLPEADGAFCARLGKNCGAVTAFDNCGATRTVASCGVCGSHFESCGGGWVANVCGCTPESDWAFCTRLGRACGTASGTDSCGVARTVTCGAACSIDAGPEDSGVVDAGGSTGDAAGQLACGRFRVEDPGNPSLPGSGRVFDTATGLAWLRFVHRNLPPLDAIMPRFEAERYCAQHGMRLPSGNEAIAIAGTNFCLEAWPAGWGTWTSGGTATCPNCLWVWSDSRTSDHGESLALCVSP